MNPTREELQKLLADAQTVAVVGASPDPEKPSHGVMRKLLSVGYRVFPVNPRASEVLGLKTYPSLKDVPEKIDIVDVFRRPEHTSEIAAEAVAIGAKALWLQLGISNEEAATRAREGGLVVVMDACIGVMHSLLRIPPK